MNKRISCGYWIGVACVGLLVGAVVGVLIGCVTTTLPDGTVITEVDLETVAALAALIERLYDALAETDPESPEAERVEDWIEEAESYFDSLEVPEDRIHELADALDALAGE
jgi:hypothetical protein